MTRTATLTLALTAALPGTAGVLPAQATPARGDALQADPVQAAGARPGAAPVPGGGTLADSSIVTVRPGTDPRGIARTAASPRFVYSSALNGFAAHLNADSFGRYAPTATRWRSSPTARWRPTPPSPWRSAAASTGSTASTRSALSGSYTWSSAGARVTAYVIGIAAAHPDFGGRAVRRTTSSEVTGPTATGTAPTSPAPSAARPPVSRCPSRCVV